jgi:hypothetical protein
MFRNLLFLVVLSSACPVGAQNDYPSTPLPTQPYPPQPAFGEPQAYGRPPMTDGAVYPSTPVAARPVGDAQYQYEVAPKPTTAPTLTSGVGIMIEDGRFRESTWYSRIDYYHWNERMDNADFVNEYGTLITVGYENRFEQQRYRGELFGSTVKYVGSSQSPGLPDVPLHSNTKYLGFRLEYDYLFEPEGLPNVSFFAGLGTRFWIRDMPDDFDDNGAPVTGYQETWWTIYPYIGVERRRTHDDSLQLYYSARIGATPITYQRIEDFATTLYPQCGLTGAIEGGVRGRRFLLSAYVETMSWSQSDIVRDSLQPFSSFTTVGLRAGYCF